MAEQFGVDGVRYVVLREVPFDRDADVSYDGFVRRYNADLANDFGNLLNRTLNMTAPLPRRRASSREPTSRHWRRMARGMGDVRRSDGAYLLGDALAALWDFVGEANRFVDREQPWALAKQAATGDAAAAERLRGALADLLEACRRHRACRGAVHARRRAARVRAARARVSYAADGSGGPPLADARLGSSQLEGGRIGTPEILFPRVEMAPPTIGGAISNWEAARCA